MSINEESHMEPTKFNGSVPTTKKPFNGTDPGYNVDEKLNSIIAAMIFSNGIELVNRPGHHQWKVKRAALIITNLTRTSTKMVLKITE